MTDEIMGLAPVGNTTRTIDLLKTKLEYLITRSNQIIDRKQSIVVFMSVLITSVVSYSGALSLNQDNNPWVILVGGISLLLSALAFTIAFTLIPLIGLRQPPSYLDTKSILDIQKESVASVDYHDRLLQLYASTTKEAEKILEEVWRDYQVVIALILMSIILGIAALIGLYS